MTRTRNPQKRIWWVVEVLEREESRGGEAEEVVEVVDRKCWTLHRRDSLGEGSWAGQGVNDFDSRVW